MMKKTDNFSRTIKVGRVAAKSSVYTDMKDGRQYVRFTLAVNKDKDKPDYYNCIAYNASGRYVDRHIQVGDKILVIGTDSFSVNKAANGMLYKSVYVEADKVFPYESEAAEAILDASLSLFSYAEGRIIV